MHDSARRSNLIFGAIALAIAIVLGGHHPSHAAEDSQQRGEEIENAVDMVSPPTRLTVEEEACADAEQAGRDDTNYHDKRDLCAQYRAAVAAEQNTSWARWQFLLGVLGLAIVGYTLVLNATATDAATSQARIAQESLAAERRPWVSIQSVEIAGPLVVTGNHLRVTINVTMENVGASPAMSVILDPAITGETDTKALRQRHNDIRTRMKSAEPHPFVDQVIFPGAQTPPERIVVGMDPATLAHQFVRVGERRFALLSIMGVVSYRSNYDTAVHTSGFSVMLIRRNDRDLQQLIRFPSDDFTMPADELDLVRMPWGWFAD